MNEFYAILTETGLAKIAALTKGKTISLTHMVIGDGDKIPPNESMTKLINEVHRVVLTKLVIGSTSPNIITAEAIITGEHGGFWIREIGLIDSDGDLFAVGKYPATYKPVVLEGSVKEICIRMVLCVTNSDNTFISYDSGIIQGANTNLDNLTFVGQKKFNDKAPLVSAELTGTPTAPTPDIDSKDNKIATTEFVRAIIPAGVVLSAPMNKINGFLICDGASVSRELFADLFNAVGETFGAGDGNTTFNIPDYRGVFLRGMGGNSKQDFVTVQKDAAPNIYGTIGVLNKGGGNGSGAISSSIWGTKDSYSSGYDIGRTVIFDASRSSTSYGKDNTTEVRPVNMSVNLFIKY